MIFSTHPLFKHLIEFKELRAKIEDLKIGYELNNYFSIRDYISFFPEEKKIEIEEIKETEIPDLWIDNEYDNLEALIIHTPGNEIKRITPENAEFLLFDSPVEFKQFKDDYEEFKNELKDVKTIEFRSLLKKALLKKESEILDLCMDIAKKENLTPELLRGLLMVYEKEGVDVFIKVLIEGSKEVELFKPLPNLIFTRDIGFVIKDKIFGAKMAKKARKREEILANFVFKTIFEKNYVNPIKDLGLSEEESIEGGDILIVKENTILAGVSDRTQMSSLKKLMEYCFKEFNDEDIKFYIIHAPLQHPRSMHLDTFLGIISDKKCVFFDPLNGKEHMILKFDKNGGIKKPEVIFSKLEDFLRDIIGFTNCTEIKDINVQFNDGLNILTLSPNKSIHYDLENLPQQIRSIGIKGWVLMLGRGGPHCLSLPLKRKKRKRRNKDDG